MLNHHDGHDARRTARTPGLSGDPGAGDTRSTGSFLRDVLAGLAARPKTLPCKYFYDRRGVELYGRICTLEEYYLTRTEVEILAGHGAEIAARLGRRCTLVEYGSGSVEKLELLLAHLDEPAAYVPVDLSRTLLDETTSRLAERFPRLSVRPVCADFARPFAVPAAATSERTVAFFPGSTIGNFPPDEAVPLLAGMRALCAAAGLVSGEWSVVTGAGPQHSALHSPLTTHHSPHGRVLVGIDLRKDAAILRAAYDDPRGVTAAFNLNLLARINRELGADFELSQFRHRAVFNEAEGRIEMHLVSLCEQAVDVGGRVFPLAAGETLHTENCYKYTVEGFGDLAARAGLAVEGVWSDRRGWFAEVLLAPV